jgi:hypothetical protein
VYVYWFHGREMPQGEHGYHGRVLYVGSTGRYWEHRCNEHWRKSHWIQYAAWPPRRLVVDDGIHLRAVEQLVIGLLKPVFNERRADGFGWSSCSAASWDAAKEWFEAKGQWMVLQIQS